MTKEKHLGLGVILKKLGGNESTVNAINNALGKKIKKISLLDNELNFHFEDGYKIKIYDGGQSCCETRYMSTDDDLAYFIDSLFLDIEIKDAPNISDEYGEHEVQFLEIKTSIGPITFANHNEHNGYYGGFYIEVSELQ